MEEYFAPMGDGHKILDGRDAHPVPWLLIGIGSAVLLLLSMCVGGWMWQRSRVFLAPASSFTLRITDAEALSTTPWPAFLGTAWQPHVRKTVLPVSLGGTLAEPSWMIAPRWKRMEGWTKAESQGLYTLFVRSAHDLNAAKEPQSLRLPLLQDVDAPLLAHGVLRDAQTSYLWALSAHALHTSFPLIPRRTIMLDTPYENSYAIQDQPFDSLILSSLAFHEQGLAPWRSSLDTISWTRSPSFEPWAVSLRPDAAPLFVNASSTQELFALRDGTFARTLTSPTSSSLRVTSGEVPPASSSKVCALEAFEPIARFEDLPILFSEEETSWKSVALGAINGQMVLCLLASPAVDK